MKNIVQLLLLSVVGAVAAKAITNTTVDKLLPPPAAKLNGFIDPYELGLGCDCDLGFVGCEDMGVGPAPEGVGSLRTAKKKDWRRTSKLPALPRNRYQSPPLINWERRASGPSQFSLKGTELGDYLSPNTLDRMAGANYPWGVSYDSGLSGLGKFSIKKAFKTVTAPVKKAHQMVRKSVQQVSKVALSPVKAANKVIAQQLKKGVQMAKRDVQRVNKTVQGGFNAVIAATGGKTPFKAANSNRRVSEPPSSTSVAGEDVYQDADGKVITKAEYDRQMSEAYQSPPFIGPGGQVVTDFQDADGNSISKDEYDRINAQTTADDAGKQAWEKRDAVVSDDGFNDSGADDQNWRAAQGDGFVDQSFDTGEAYNSGNNRVASAGQDAASDDSGIIVDADGVSWWQDDDGSWLWFDQQKSAWFKEPGDGAFIAEAESTQDASMQDQQFDGSDELGQLYDRNSGNPLAVVIRSGTGVAINPLQVDGKGRVFASNGRKQRQVGTVNTLAAAEGQAGLGFKIFGKSFSKFSDFAKDVASKATPSGALYKLAKRRTPSKVKEFHKVVKTATPYAVIAAGVVLEVVSIGTLTPVAAGVIAAGVVSAGAQGYSDVKAHQTAKMLERTQNESDAEVARIERASQADIERTRIAQAGSDAANSDRIDKPVLSWAWWMGDIDESSTQTYGEVLENAGV